MRLGWMRCWRALASATQRWSASRSAGWLALEYVTTHPQKATALVLLCPGGVGQHRNVLLSAAAGARPGAERGSCRSSARPSRPARPHRRRRVRGLQCADPQGLHRAPRAPAALLHAALQRLTMPVMAILGGRDAFIDRLDPRAVAANAAPRRHPLLPEASHFLMGHTAEIDAFYARSFSHDPRGSRARRFSSPPATACRWPTTARSATSSASCSVRARLVAVCRAAAGSGLPEAVDWRRGPRPAEAGELPLPDRGGGRCERCTWPASPCATSSGSPTVARRSGSSTTCRCWRPGCLKAVPLALAGLPRRRRWRRHSGRPPGRPWFPGGFAVATGFRTGAASWTPRSRNMSWKAFIATATPRGFTSRRSSARNCPNDWLSEKISKDGSIHIGVRRGELARRGPQDRLE